MTQTHDCMPMYKPARGGRLFVDPVHRRPRLWSNSELSRVGALFEGDVVNVSAWRDEDKEGGFYRRYFPNARSYRLTNFQADMRGFQGWQDEIFLDLEADLPDPLGGAFDVVFNHTTLEHIYEFRKAFANMCALSRDAVIIVAPWLQPYHSDYGDYWRFSPVAIARLLLENGVTPARITWNKDKRASVYVFAIGVKRPERWQNVFEFGWNPQDASFLALTQDFAGREALPKPPLETIRALVRRTGLRQWLRTMSGQAL